MRPDTIPADVVNRRLEAAVPPVPFVPATNAWFACDGFTYAQPPIEAASVVYKTTVGSYQIDTAPANDWSSLDIGQPGVQDSWAGTCLNDSPSQTLYIADLQNEEHVRAWRTLERLQLRTDAAQQQAAAAEAFERSRWVPASIYTTVLRTTQALPDSVLPKVAGALQAWRIGTPSGAEIRDTLDLLWHEADIDARAHVASFREAMLAGLRRGAFLRRLVGLASLRARPRLRALLTRWRPSAFRVPPVLRQLSSTVVRRGPPGVSLAN